MTPLVGSPVVYVEKAGDQRAAFITKVHGDERVDLAFFLPVSERMTPKTNRRMASAGHPIKDATYAVAEVPRCSVFDKKPSHWFWR